MCGLVAHDDREIGRGATLQAGDEMADRPPKILICSCEDTMPLDGAAVQRGCRGAQVLTARQLCRAELDKFRAAADVALRRRGRFDQTGHGHLGMAPM